MQAIIFERSGKSDVFELTEIERPEPGDGEVRVRLETSGVNPSDWKSRAAAVFHFPPGGRQIPHHDGVGRIDAVGRGVAEERVGQRVWVYFSALRRPWGTAAQWTVVNAQRAVPLADDVPDHVGASLGIPAITAHRLLGDLAELRGSTILVQGFGAVGFAALQLARWAGARVIVTSSSAEKRSAASAGGAVASIDYRADDALEQIREAAPGGVRRIIEVSLGTNLQLDLDVLTPNTGRIAVYATEGPAEFVFPTRRLINLNAGIDFVMVYGLTRPETTQAVHDITQALEQGYLRGYPVQRFPLSDTAAAQDAGAGGVFAKILIDIP